MKKLTVLLLSLFTALSVFASSKNLIHKETFSANLDNLEVKMFSEDVTIKEIYGDEIIVEVYSNNKRLMPKITKGTNSLEIYSSRKSIRFGEYCSIEISIPEETKFKNISMAQTSGDIDIETLYADNITIDSTSGDLEAEKLTADYKMVLRKTSGDIEIDNLATDELVLSSTSGTIKVGKINAIDTSLVTTSGSIKIGKLDTESYDVTVTSGSVKISAISADYFNVNSTSGSINMEFESAPVATSKITSTSGSIDLYFLSKDGFNIEFTSSSGSYSDGINGLRAGKHISESFFNGGSDIFIRTTSGSVSIDD